MRNLILPLVLFASFSTATAHAGYDCTLTGDYNIFDVNADRRVDSQDSYIILLYLFGYSESYIKSSVNSPSMNRVNLVKYLNTVSKYMKVTDINGDGVSDALSDGIILNRYFLGTRGDDLAQGTVSDASIFKTGRELEDRIVSLLMRYGSVRCS